MRIAFFSAKPHDTLFFDRANEGYRYEVHYFEVRLTLQTALLAHGFDVVCGFVNDDFGASVLEVLKQGGTRLIALRCAGFNQVDQSTARVLELPVVRVPAYSPHAVAEHALGLIMVLNRKIHRAYNRTREGNFSLDGLMGFDLYGKTVGVIGTGAIGSVFARVMRGLGCEVIAFDPAPDVALATEGISYTDLAQLYAQSNIVSLHCPLTPDTVHLIDERAIDQMHDDVMLINTSRGPLVDTKAIINGLKRQKIGALGLDVYEEESNLFFENRSNTIIQDDVFARLLTFPNVIVTSHQGFFTNEAVTAIAQTTLANIQAFEQGQTLKNAVC